MNTGRAEQRPSNLATRDRISRDEARVSTDLYQHTSYKDWAMEHQSSDGLPQTSPMEVVQRSMGQKGRLLIWIGLAVMLII